MSQASILVVDDEIGIRRSLKSILVDEGFEVHVVSSGEACLEALPKNSYDVVLLDVWLPGLDGLEVLERIHELEMPPAVIMITGHGKIETAVRATKLGAYDFLEKPLSLEKTLLTIQHALEQQQLQTQNRRLKEELSAQYLIIGDSVPMKALRQQIALTAPTNGRVLVYGESGTGKELVAHALHQKSQRVDQSLVEVNCAAIPEELIESELFGHKKGSFTGAAEDKEGKFQKADGGTLFLDEVGDMSLKTQARVLRVLEEQRFSPVGSSETLCVNVRVIAATNKNLDEEIQKGNFREDLFFRLNVIPFYLPALREHPEDVPLLTDYFLREFARTYGRRPKHFSENALEVLVRYRWPGNVRELKNLIERLVIMVPGERIDRRHLPSNLLHDRQRLPASGAGFTSLRQVRQASERDYILRKLEEHQGNVSRAAESLGLDRSHLYRKMKSLGIPSRQAPKASSRAQAESP